MDCYEWRNCEGDCDNCEVANTDIAQAVQHWPDADFMTHNYSPEEILGLLRQLGEQTERAERERDQYRKTLHSLLLEAECHAGISKHLMRECEEARRVLGDE